MDFKFPKNKVFKTRYCFQCKKSIDFSEYYIRNKSYPEHRLIQLWENNNLEFYCCLCYDDFIQNEKLKNLRNSLNDKQQDILRIIEKRCKIEIPVVLQIDYDTIGVFIHNGKIKGLSLFKSLKFFPEEITMIRSLEKLNLAWNQLRFLPNSITNLISIKELDLIGNELTSIPEQIGQLNSLVELDLSFNHLQTIPETINNLSNLRYLNLIHNNIIYIPESIKSLEKKGLKILL